MIIKPKTLFLIDSAGAFLTAFTLFVPLRTFHEYIGMPPLVLTYLSILAAMFCLYSFLCFKFLTSKWSPFLTVISIANLLYCCLTLTLVINHFPQLTTLGFTYFIVEIVVIFGLVYIELKTARAYKNN